MGPAVEPASQARLRCSKPSSNTCGGQGSAILAHTEYLLAMPRPRDSSRLFGVGRPHFWRLRRPHARAARERSVRERSPPRMLATLARPAKAAQIPNSLLHPNVNAQASAPREALLAVRAREGALARVIVHVIRQSVRPPVASVTVRAQGTVGKRRRPGPRVSACAWRGAAEVRVTRLASRLNFKSGDGSPPSSGEWSALACARSRALRVRVPRVGHLTSRNLRRAV
jgi:hypothetical protein